MSHRRSGTAPFAGRVPGPRGITMVEVLITMSIMLVIVAVIVPFFNLSISNYSGMEARSSIGNANQKAVNRILARLTECKRIFEGDASGDNDFLKKVVAGRPPELAGGALPVINETGSLNPGTTSFVRADVGNRLFFAGVDAPKDIAVVGGTVTIDTYRFHFYTVGPQHNPKVLGGKNAATLWEWHSAPYADFVELNSLVGSTQTLAVKGLYSRGVQYAWDASAPSAAAAFYELTSGGTGLDSPRSDHTIAQETSRPEFKTQDMQYTVPGSMSFGFHYGLCPNNLDPDDPRTSPKFANPGMVFPNGFETFIVGPAAARKVALRSVMAAKGGFKGFIINEQVLVISAKDVW